MSFSRSAAAIAVVALGVAGCTSSATGGTSGGSAKGRSVIYIAPDPEGFYVQANCGAKRVAARAGVRYSVQYGKDFSAASQVPLINSAVASRPAAILVSASDTKALNVTLKQAAANGVKVITVANGVSESSFLSSAVQGNNDANGRKAADLMAELAHGRQGEIGYLGFTPGGSAITDARQRGFTQQLKKYPNLQLIEPRILSTVDATTGAAATNALLSAHPHLLGIVGSFVPVADGMATALKERGVTGQVMAIQMDADEAGIANVKAGVLQGLTAETTRTEGEKAMEQAINAIEGRSVTKNVSADPVTFTKDNVNDADMQQYVTRTAC